MKRSLEERLAARITAEGPLSVADYMAACLGDPYAGYYATRDPFGAAGDFVTAPEMSQMFGEIIGAWMVEAWRGIGAPARFDLVELGPGRGTLMADIVRVGRLVPAFLAAMRIHLVETSPVLRHIQRERLAPFGVAPSWHDALPQAAGAPMLAVANEFFDALPARQYVRRGGAWHERRIGCAPEGGLRFVLGPPLPESTSRLPVALPAGAVPEGAVLERSAAAEAICELAASRIAADGGALLIIDYGSATTGFADTFQAVRAHRKADPLGEPGRADLTVHVNFAALAAAAARGGARVHGPLTQAAFLLGLGLLERAGQLGAACDAAGRKRISAEVERLAGGEQMGELFKAMAITSPTLLPEPFDHDA